MSFVQGTSLDGRRWSTCAVFECSLEELAFGRELLEEEASETNACVVVRSGLLNPPFESNKSHTTEASTVGLKTLNRHNFFFMRPILNFSSNYSIRGNS